MAVINFEGIIMQIRNLASGLAVAAVTLVSFSSSAIGISKVMSPWQPKTTSEVEVPKIKSEANDSTERPEITEVSKKSSGSLALLTQRTETPKSVSKLNSTPVINLPTVSVTRAPVNSTQCLVTLFGIQYDVSPLRSTHGGGDIFICNSDMTVTFQSRHMDIAIMAKYKVTTGTTGGSTTGGSTTGTNTLKHEDNDLEDDSEDEKSESEHLPETESRQKNSNIKSEIDS